MIDSKEMFEFCSLRKDYLLEKIETIRLKSGIEVEMSDSLVERVINAYELFVTEILEEHRDDDVLTALIIMCITEMQWEIDTKLTNETKEKLSKLEFKGTNPTERSYDQKQLYLKKSKFKNLSEE